MSKEEYNRLIADNLALSRELTNKERLADAAKKRLDDAKEAIKRYTTANKNLVDENKALDVRNKELENELRDVNGVLQGPEGASQVAKTPWIDQLQNDNAKLVGDVLNLMNRIVDRDDNIEELKKKKSNIEEENENLNDNIKGISGKKAVYFSSSDLDISARSQIMRLKTLILRSR
jgi:chromosome segregation ATPase